MYRSGKLSARVRIADDVSQGGLRAPRISALERLLFDFLRWQPVTPGSAEAPADYLAPLARMLRDEVLESLLRGDSPVRALAREWGGLLFPESDDAQTLTYALLLARFEGADSLRPAIAADALQGDHALLASAISLMEAESVREGLWMSIDLLERGIGAVDVAAMRDGGGGTRGSTSTSSS